MVVGLSAALAVVCTAPRTQAEEPREAPPSPESPSAIWPRWTPLEIQTPGIVGGSGGLWVLLPAGIRHRVGLAADLGLGLGGVDLAVGPGILRPELEAGAPHEKGWSVAVQGLLYRTWPGWTPRLPTSTTYVGGDISAGYIMYRCWAGAMRRLDDRESAWIAIGGVGIGIP